MAYGPPQFTIQHHMPRMMPAMPLARPGQGPVGLAKLLQQPGLRDLLMATGTALLAQTDQPGNVLGALGRALPFGMEALQRGREEAQINELMETAPPEMRALLKALPSQARVPALLQLMKKPEPTKLNKNERLVGANNEILVDAVPEEAKPSDPFDGLSSEMRDALFSMGVADPAQMTEEQRKAALKVAGEIKAAGRGPLVTVNTGDKAASAAGTAIGGNAAQRVIDSASTASAALGLVEDITTAETLLQDPAMKRVAGPASSLRTVAQRLGDDPKARELAAQFDILTSDIVLQKVKAFKGPLSEKELAFLERASAADRNMTVEELQAGLKLLKRVSERDLSDYVKEFDAFNPAEFDVTEGQMQQFRSLADRARGVGSSKPKADPLGIRG